MLLSLEKGFSKIETSEIFPFQTFRRKKLKYAIGSACIGGGQGIALLLESC